LTRVYQKWCATLAVVEVAADGEVAVAVATAAVVVIMEVV